MERELDGIVLKVSFLCYETEVIPVRRKLNNFHVTRIALSIFAITNLSHLNGICYANGPLSLTRCAEVVLRKAGITDSSVRTTTAEDSP